MQGRESDEKVKVMWNQEGNIPPPLLNSLFTKGKICTRFLFLNISEWYTDPISKQSFLMQFGDARTRKWKWCGIRRETFRPLLASHFLCPNNRSGQLQQFLPAQPENPVFQTNFIQFSNRAAPPILQTLSLYQALLIVRYSKRHRELIVI